MQVLVSILLSTGKIEYLKFSILIVLHSAHKINVLMLGNIYIVDMCNVIVDNLQADKYGVNVCGEGGEYETFTLDCPLFHKRLIMYYAKHDHNVFYISFNFIVMTQVYVCILMMK